MPTPKKPLTREDELMKAANRLATLKLQRRKKLRELQVLEDSIRFEGRALRALAQQLAGVNDDVETPMPIVDAEPEK